MPHPDHINIKSQPIAAELSPAQSAEMFQLDPAEVEAMAKARDIIMPQITEILDEHYSRIQVMPDAPKLLGDAGKVERLKAGVRMWVGQSLLGQPDAAQPTMNFTQMGIRHVHIGVPLSYIVAAFGELQRLCVDALRRAESDSQLNADSAELVIGALHKRFTAEQLGFVAAYTRHTADQARNMRMSMAETIEKRSSALKSTVSLSEAIAGEIDERDIYLILANHIIETFGTDYFEANVLSGPVMETVVVVKDGVVTHPEDNSFTQGIQQDWHKCRTARMARSFSVPDVSKALIKCPYEPNEITTGSYCCLPLASGPELLGWFHVSHSSPGHFDDEVLEVLNIYGRMVGEAVASLRLNEQNRRQAHTDPLTGLFNRRHFEEVVAREQMLLERRPQPTSMIMLDVDKFKTFNDSYGHDVGDRVLVTLSNVLRRCMRKADDAARIGGDEMLVMLRNCDGPQAKKVGENIIASVAAEPIEISSTETVSIHITAGIADCPGAADTLDEAIKLADAALLQAKNKGRNQCGIAEGAAKPVPV